MSFRPATSLRRERGFIITTELVLVVTILGIGLIVGLAAIRNTLFEYWLTRPNGTIWILDSAADPLVLGEVLQFDEHEAPMLIYVDRNVDPSRRALVGVRRDRFTSRAAVYYTGLGCTGTPYMKLPNQINRDHRGVSGLPQTGATGYFYQVQGTFNYAIGSSDPTFVTPSAVNPLASPALPGRLYRSDATGAPITGLLIQSRWLSQLVTFREPCENGPTVGVGANFFPAVEVLNPAGTANALDGYTLPFRATIPLDPADINFIDPTAESGPASGTLRFIDPERESVPPP